MKAPMLCLLLVLVGCSAEEKQTVRDEAKAAMDAKRKLALICLQDVTCRQFVLEEVKKVVK